MATTQLSDVIIPEVYRDYTAVDSPEKTALFESGAVVRNALLDQTASSGGNMVNLPFWRDLDADDEPNVSTDDPSSSASPKKVTAGEMVARVAYLNQGYSAADLAGELAGSEPMQHVRNRFGRYWRRQWQRRIVSACNGVLAANIANDGGDMVFGAADVFSREAFVAAAYTMGDAVEGLSAIAVHSSVMQQMVNQDGIEYIKGSDGVTLIPTYLGKRVIVDDGLPAVATTPTTGAIQYTSILFGAGAFGYGEGSAKVPVELERQAAQGNGGGIETLWERNTWILHPIGHTFKSASVASVSPTNAELALPANWERVIERKNVPIAFLTSTEIAPTGD